MSETIAPSTRPSKRALLISTAFQLFYEKGVHAVGINEILAASGIAKKTLYNHFSSKEDLLQAAMHYRNALFCHWLESELEEAEAGSAKIDALFYALDDWFNDRTKVLTPFHGCFFINVSAEYGDLTNPMHKNCALHKSHIEHLIRRAVITLTDDPENIAVITRALCMLKEGATVQAYIQGDKQAALKAREAAIMLIKGSVK